MNNDIRFILCPFTGEKLACVPALRPDVTIIHAQRADREGNVLIEGIVGVQKEAVLAAQLKGFFTIPHFDGYAAVLIQLKAVTKRALREAIIDGWLACAPASLANSYIDQKRSARRR